jgi:hypothetical protein
MQVLHSENNTAVAEGIALVFMRSTLNPRSLRNARKMECGANRFLTRQVSRALNLAMNRLTCGRPLAPQLQ